MAGKIQDNAADNSGVRLIQQGVEMQARVREAAFDNAVRKLAERTRIDTNEVGRRLINAFEGFASAGENAAQAFLEFDENFIKAVGGADEFNRLIDESTHEAEAEYLDKLKLIAKGPSRRLKVRRDSRINEPSAYKLGKDEGLKEGLRSGRSQGYEKGFREGVEQGKKIRQAEYQRQKKTVPQSVDYNEARQGTRQWQSVKYSFRFDVERDVMDHSMIARAVITRKQGERERSIEIYSRVPYASSTILNQAQRIESLVVGLVSQAQPYCDTSLFIEAIMIDAMRPVAALCRVNAVDVGNMRLAMYRAAGIDPELL